VLDDLSGFLHDFASGPISSGGPNYDIQVAVIGLVGIVASALIAGYFGTRGERASRALRAMREAQEAEDDAEDDAERAVLRQRCEELSARVAVLCSQAVRNGRDPDRIVTGKELDADVAF
jgi:hypothetical protein